MVEVRTLEPDQKEPTGNAWVLIEGRGGLYFITGRNDGQSIYASIRPLGFSSLQVASHAAAAWADLLTTPTLYVRAAANTEAL
jgi:hypothetical protein